jgi:NAD(P)H-hydrate epimerase
MHELLSCAEMRQAEGLAIAEGLSGIELMERAGAAAAGAAAAMAAPGRAILVLCGPGNNGGDGFVAARLLAEAGWRVETVLLGERARLRGDAETALARHGAPVTDAAAAEPNRFGIVVDALFGAGLNRDLDGAAAALIARTNRAGVPVLSVDLPSGIDGDSGQIRGVAIRATRTITFFRCKPGHLLFPGRAHCGVVTIADIGIEPATLRRVGCRTFANEPALWQHALTAPDIRAHKYSRGHCLVVSGPGPKTGASRLAARAALRAGAGLVTLAAPASVIGDHAAQLTAAMLASCENADDLGEILTDRRISSIAIGPGLGRGVWAKRMVAAALAADRSTVLDADALTVVAEEPEMLTPAPGRAAPIILTPHDGEFCRFSKLFSRINNKFEETRALAQKIRAVTIRKGADTVIASPDGRAAINGNAPPTLATAGAGDVLAGLVGGCLAQGMPAFEAACATVWIHGEAAKRFGPGLTADDLPELVPGVLATLIRS